MALREAIALPPSVRGPVDFRAFRRLAAVCLLVFVKVVVKVLSPLLSWGCRHSEKLTVAPEIQNAIFCVLLR